MSLWNLSRKQNATGFMQRMRSLGCVVTILFMFAVPVCAQLPIENTFYGTNAGISNTTGDFNSFFGDSAGTYNTTGTNNNFFGKNAGNHNTTGDNNSFFGVNAGFRNTTGGYNAFFGGEVGAHNSTGNGNSFFGIYAGNANTTGNNNIFFGFSAGVFNTTGSNNSFFGNNAGAYNSTGIYNTYVGYSAGFSNTTGNYNVFVGADSNPIAPTDDATDTNTIRIGYPYNGTVQPAVGQNRTFISGIVGSPVSESENPSVVGVTSDGRLGTFPAQLLPKGPEGPQGPAGSQGPTGPMGPVGLTGPGLVSGSLLFLPVAVTTTPPGFTLFGSMTLQITLTGSKRATPYRVNVYKMN